MYLLGMLLLAAVAADDNYSQAARRGQEAVPPPRRRRRPAPAGRDRWSRWAPGGPGGPGGPGQAGRRFPNVRSQIFFLDPDGMKIGWQTGGGASGERVYLPAQLTVPARYNFMQGYIYRLKLTDIPGRPDVVLYPTIEVAPSTPATDAYLTHNPIPVQFTAEDFDQVVDGGNFVTKVIYLPDPKLPGAGHRRGRDAGLDPAGAGRRPDPRGRQAGHDPADRPARRDRPGDAQRRLGRPADGPGSTAGPAAVTLPPGTAPPAPSPPRRSRSTRPGDPGGRRPPPCRPAGPGRRPPAPPTPAAADPAGPPAPGPGSRPRPRPGPTPGLGPEPGRAPDARAPAGRAHRRRPAGTCRAALGGRATGRAPDVL